MTNVKQQIAAELGRVLADTYTLYTKTQGFHWNVTGPQFHSLHGLFEEQYTELAGAIDTVAERIRALGSFAPSSLAQLNRLSSVSEEHGAPSAGEMLTQLIEGHRMVQATIRNMMDFVTEAKDLSTEDLLVERLRAHEKADWMLRAHLEQPIQTMTQSGSQVAAVEQPSEELVEAGAK